MRREPKVYLNDILEALQKIKNYTEGLNFNKFSEDSRTQDATIRNFEIIGEATKKIPQKIKRKYPQIPWREMSGMRDKLIHEYFGVNRKVLWKTIKEDLPPLEPLIKKVLKEMEGGTKRIIH